MVPVSKSWKICNFNNTCGHKHDGSLTYQKSAQNLEAYRKIVHITVIFNNFQSCKPLILAKISGVERNLKLICNSSWLAHIPKISPISESI